VGCWFELGDGHANHGAEGTMSTKKTIRQLHREAMAKVDEAITARLHGKYDMASDLFCQAFYLEREAASQAHKNLEPASSIFHYSAATLAILCEEFGEAEKLIAKAFTDQTPEEIEEDFMRVKDEWKGFWKEKGET
jgi:hypothetical protein